MYACAGSTSTGCSYQTGISYDKEASHSANSKPLHSATKKNFSSKDIGTAQSKIKKIDKISRRSSYKADKNERYCHTTSKWPPTDDRKFSHKNSERLSCTKKQWTTYTDEKRKVYSNDRRVSFVDNMGLSHAAEKTVSPTESRNFPHAIERKCTLPNSNRNLSQAEEEKFFFLKNRNIFSTDDREFSYAPASAYSHAEEGQFFDAERQFFHAERPFSFEGNRNNFFADSTKPYYADDRDECVDHMPSKRRKFHTSFNDGKLNIGRQKRLQNM